MYAKDFCNLFRPIQGRSSSIPFGHVAVPSCLIRADTRCRCRYHCDTRHGEPSLRSPRRNCCITHVFVRDGVAPLEWGGAAAFFGRTLRPCTNEDGQRTGKLRQILRCANDYGNIFGRNKLATKPRRAAPCRAATRPMSPLKRNEDGQRTVFMTALGAHLQGRTPTPAIAGQRRCAGPTGN